MSNTPMLWGIPGVQFSYNILFYLSTWVQLKTLFSGIIPLINTIYPLLGYPGYISRHCKYPDTIVGTLRYVQMSKCPIKFIGHSLSNANSSQVIHNIVWLYIL